MKQTPRRMVILIAIVTTITLVAAACGDSTTDVGVPSDDVATTAAPDEPLGAGPYPIADISFAIHPDGVDSAATANYRLSCLGDTASVSGDAPGAASQMCLELKTLGVGELLVNGPPADQVCTENWGGPDVALITGTLDGETIDTEANRINGCAINDWDATLAGLLPAA